MKDVRNSRAYARFRLAVLRRDKYTCQDCGRKNRNKLEVHHIFSYALFPEEKHFVKHTGKKVTIMRLAVFYVCYCNSVKLWKNGEWVKFSANNLNRIAKECSEMGCLSVFCFEECPNCKGGN